MSPSSLISSLFASLPALFISAPDASWWTWVVLWLIRLATLSFLLRTYIIPWALAHMNRRVRVRSISLRSIRGLYIRRGNYTVRIERLGYNMDSLVDGWRIIVEGLLVEVRKSEKPPVALPRHRRSLTLHRISQLERGFWNALTFVHSMIGPMLRPIIRHWFISALHVIVRRIPQKVTLDIRPLSVVFPDASNATITSDLLRLDFNVNFFLRERRRTYGPRPTHPRVNGSHPSYSVGAWNNRFRASVSRSFNTVLEETEGKASITLHLRNIYGFAPTKFGRGTFPTSLSSSILLLTSETLFIIPGATESELSLRFVPRSRRIDTHSLSATLTTSKCEVELSPLLGLFQQLKRQTSADSEPFPLPFGSKPFSPMSSSMMSPISPRSPWSAAYSSSEDTPKSPVMKALSVSLQGMQETQNN